jgi:asparagine synthase (glutamine-hydrolysing)
MCGIAGFWNPDGVDVAMARDTVTAMTDAIRHRGPDQGDVWIDAAAGIALGARRLAIIDLSPTGHQPMHDSTGRYVIVFNGEIYNHHQLRDQLTALGHGFRGRADTEVLIEAVRAWGVRGALERCNGMFAFALWDRKRRVLHLARDRAGEKPLYYGWTGNTLRFGSELKALRADPTFRGEIDRPALMLYFRRGYIPGPWTIYRDVYKLPPASLLTIRAAGNRRTPRPSRYWELDAVAERGVAYPFRGSEADALAQLDQLLQDAVKLRMEADVPLGAFLSGGVDSSLIVALMQAQTSQRIRTFTIGFREDRYNEAPHAAAVARHLGTEHTEFTVTPDEARDVIPLLPTIYDEPFADTSQIPTFLISKLTRQHVTVSLSGDAGDELFGGYRRYHLGPAIWRGIGKVPLPLRTGLAAALRLPPMLAGPLAHGLDRLARPVTGKRSLTERMRQTADLLRAPSVMALYSTMMSFWTHPADLIPGAREPRDPMTSASRWPDLHGSAEHAMMYLDTAGYLPDDILVKVDRAAMATSLESRIPLLDHRVIEFAWQLPLSFKFRGGEGKWPLRQLLYRYVPQTAVERPKQGFGMPIAAWLTGPLRDWAESLLDERHLRTSGLLDPGPIRRKWREHLSGITRWDYQLWTTLMFESWRAAQPTAQLRTPLRILRSA